MSCCTYMTSAHQDLSFGVSYMWIEELLHILQAENEILKNCLKKVGYHGNHVFYDFKLLIIHGYHTFLGHIDVHHCGKLFIYKLVCNISE